jgi:hypothetical protein
MDDAIARIEPEAERVERHKAAIADALKPVVAACEAARKDGFYPEFQVTLNQFGFYVSTPVGLVRRY